VLEVSRREGPIIAALQSKRDADTKEVRK